MTTALSPAVVAAVEDLEVAARLVVEGLRSGSHSSPFHGFSAEFRQHRPYRAGDDIKHLDWKLLARTDRLYSRQFRETTNMSVMLVLDASASMAYPATGVSKFRYASVIAAALAYLVSSQGDAVGLMTMVDGRLEYLPARGGRMHLRSLVARLDALHPAGAWAPDRVVARGAELLKRRGLVVVISDFYDGEAATQRELRRARRRGHDVAMLQVLSPDEIAFTFAGDLEFADLETGERRVIAAADAAPSYRSGMADFLVRCADTAVREGIGYALMNTEEPPALALRNYLVRRRALAG